MQDPTGQVFVADCPTCLAVDIVSDKWAVLVLHGLSHAPRRHGEPVELIGGISRTMLTHMLRRLQQYGLVEHRTDDAGPALYALIELGRTIIEPVEVLETRAREHGDAIADSQRASACTS